MNKVAKNLLYILISIVAAALIGTIILTVAYVMPGERIRGNVAKSESIQQIEGDSYDWGPGIPSTQIDGFTDSIMLNMAVYTSDKGPLENAIDSVCIWDDSMEGTPADMLRLHVLAGDYSGTHEWHYGRYWHGYLAFLKPMLTFFTYGEVRYLMMVIQLVLIMVLVFGIYKELGLMKVIPFLVGVLAINPITSALSMQHADVYIITIVGGIILLFNKKSLNNNYWKIFLWIGVATSFMDLLTYPLVGLGVNLVLLTILLDEEKWYIKIFKSVIASFIWVIGYVLMWVSKWCLWSIYNKQAFNEAISQIFIRTSGDSTIGRYTKSNSIFNAYIVNANLMLTKPVIAILVIAILVIVFVGCKNKMQPKNYVNIIPLFMVGIYPLIWCLVIREHSALHAIFTHRMIAIDIIVILMIIADLFKKEEV